MGFVQSRLQWRDRVIRDAHRQADTGSVTLETINEHAQDAYNEWWWLVGNHDRSALGKSHRSISITADSPTIDLPSEFQSLTGWSLLTGSARCTLPPQLVLPEVALHAGWLDSDVSGICWPNRSAYYIEGPGQAWNENTQQLETFGLRLRAFPGFRAGQTVTFTYRTQAPYLGDPSVIGEGVDLAPIEMLAAPNYRNLTALVRVYAASRGDDSEIARATNALAVGVAETMAAVNREDRTGYLSADQYIDNTRRTTGY